MPIHLRGELPDKKSHLLEVKLSLWIFPEAKQAKQETFQISKQHPVSLLDC